AEVAVTAHGRHAESAAARQAVVDAREGVDHPAIERKEEQIVKTGWQVPAVQGLVEDAVARDGAVVLEALGEKGQRVDVLVLDAAAVVPEVVERLEHRRVELALVEVVLG